MSSVTTALTENTVINQKDSINFPSLISSPSLNFSEIGEDNQIYGEFRRLLSRHSDVASSVGIRSGDLNARPFESSRVSGQ
jgi:hypothetical protein